MLPTFDLSNVIQRLVQVARATVVSPVTMWVAFVAVFVSSGLLCYNFFNDLSFPEITVNLSFASISHSIWDCLLYIVNIQAVIQVYNFFILTVKGLITLFLSFTMALFAAFLVKKVGETLHRAFSDYVK